MSWINGFFFLRSCDIISYWKSEALFLWHWNSKGILQKVIIISFNINVYQFTRQTHTARLMSLPLLLFIESKIMPIRNFTTCHQLGFDLYRCTLFIQQHCLTIFWWRGFRTSAVSICIHLKWNGYRCRLYSSFCIFEEVIVRFNLYSIWSSIWGFGIYRICA